MFSSHRFKSRLIVFVTALALAVQGLAPFGAAAAASENSLEAALKFICTANGLKHRNSLPNPDRNQSTDSCPLCPTFSTHVLAPAATSTPLPRQFVKAPALSPPVQAVTLQPSKTNISARAPPDRFV